jgi:hypothetical protein
MLSALTINSFKSELVKTAEDEVTAMKDNRRTYPVARLMTNPWVGGTEMALLPVGAGVGAKILEPHLANIPVGAGKANLESIRRLKGILKFTGKAGLALAIPAFSIGALQTHLHRKRYARALSGRLVQGKGLNASEQEAIQNLSNY